MKEFRTETSSLSDVDIIAMQNKWIKNGGTGCVFSQAVTVRSGKELINWNNNVSRLDADQLRFGPGGTDFIGTVVDSINNGDELFSTIFPNVESSRDLASLVSFLGDSSPFFIEEVVQGPVHPEDPNEYSGVYLRVGLPDAKQSWPMVLGPYSFFSGSRRAPFTQLIFRPSSIKGNPTTPDHQIGIDDIVLKIPKPTFGLMYEKTLADVAATRGSYNREMFRARVAVVVPTTDWESVRNQAPSFD